MTTDAAALARVWDEERPRLTALAYRILGSWQDAEDVVAQSWPRLEGATDLHQPAAWLTTVVTRLAIDAGRRAQARREDYVGPWLPEPVATDRLPEDVAETRSLLGLGLLRFMEQLTPEDRAVFVLREAFDVPYTEIAECVGRSPAACRQVVRRARARLGAAPDVTEADRSEHAALLTALVNAVTAGEVEQVVRLVSGDCVLWADSGGRVRATRRPVRGRTKVVAFLTGVARLLQSAEAHHVNGVPAMLFTSVHGRYLYVLELGDGQVTGIQVHANPEKLASLGSLTP
ncbi:sigma-70 family RNA polymerase sigma factor [Kytococcus sp. Marseille-QA3725]